MNDRDLQIVLRIKLLCEEISETLNRYGEKFSLFESDKDYFKSICMSVMQIAELSTKLSDSFRENTKDQMEWKSVKGIRIIFAHMYFTIDKDKVWNIVTTEVPQMLSFCNKVITYEKNNSYQTEQNKSILGRLQEIQRGKAKDASSKPPDRIAKQDKEKPIR